MTKWAKIHTPKGIVQVPFEKFAKVAPDYQAWKLGKERLAKLSEPAAPAAAATAEVDEDELEQARAFVEANPDDPRAQAIAKALGL